MENVYDKDSPALGKPLLPGVVCLTTEEAQSIKSWIEDLLLPESVEERVDLINPSPHLRSVFVKIGLLKK